MLGQCARLIVPRNECRRFDDCDPGAFVFGVSLRENFKLALDCGFGQNPQLWLSRAIPGGNDCDHFAPF